uniref:Uncharacterized protein n=1 Tax=Takifugu rubripes TaxID=31033 RepID=A0A3B5KJG6_TAKRU
MKMQRDQSARESAQTKTGYQMHIFSSGKEQRSPYLLFFYFHWKPFINYCARRRARWHASVIQRYLEAEAGGPFELRSSELQRLCGSGVRTKFGIDVVLLGEPGASRSSKEGAFL